MDIVAEWVEFEIPFLIQVEDSFEGNSDARFQVRIDGIPAEVQFKKEVREEESRPGSMFGLVEGERLGNVSYTLVRIGFARPFLDSLDEEYQSSFEDIQEGGPTRMTSSLDSREGQLIKSAIDYMNLFLERYRATFGYYWIRRLKPSEIAYFKLFSVAENGEEYNHNVMYAHKGLTPASATLDRAQHEVLQSRLTDEHEVPAAVSLRLDARDNLDLGEYKLSVILAGTMFETFLKRRLRLVMEIEGKSPSTIEQAFVRSDGRYKGVVQLAKESHKTFHFDFSGSDEYQEWMEKTRELRNEVIHEDYQPTEDEADEALTASVNAVELLEREIDERVKKLEEST